ncbi:hypothetical protein [Nocardiopsis rhodophaea]|uniref:hypothetical protein n=1 Tax=Nocardiopsis rhodophaea TaxID=280238 RepID=UPI0031DF3F59
MAAPGARDGVYRSPWSRATRVERLRTALLAITAVQGVLCPLAGVGVLIVLAVDFLVPAGVA